MKNVSYSRTKSSEKLSGGYRINNASDDASGLAISKKMRAQIMGLEQAQYNAEDGINLIITMEGGLEGIQDMMIRQRELIIKAINDTNSDDDRNKIQREVAFLTEEIDERANKTEFNNKSLLNDSSKLLDLWIQGGSNSMQGMYINRYDCRSETLGIKNLSVATRDLAQQALKDLDEAFGKVNEYRSKAGAQQNRLEHTIKSLGIAYVNMSDSNSRILDTNMAKEMMEFMKTNVLQQASTSMLTQANQDAGIVARLVS